MTYRIAGHIVRIDVGGNERILDTILPSFIPFKTDEDDNASPLLRLEVCKTLDSMPDEQCHLIREVDTGNGITVVKKIDTTGGYQFLVNNVDNQECALLITSADFKHCRCALLGASYTYSFSLNNALMLAYAFSAAYYETLLVHASVVRYGGKAFAFTAKSGTGKSTQVANWLKYIEGCDMINDDNPIIRVEDGKVILYGSPWSGKTPCYRNVLAPLGAVTLIERDQRNYVESLSPLKAFAVMLSACSAMKWDENLYQRVCETISKIVETTQVCTLHCLPDRESAIVCKDALTQKNIKEE